jgi:serralysin
LEVFDAQGNVVAIDDGQLAYGFDHVFFIAPYSGTFYINASWDQGLASSHKAVAVGIFEDLDTIPVVKQNFITGTSGPNRILGTADSDVVNGGDGVDTFVLGRQRSLYTVSVSNGTVTVTDKEGLSGVDVLQSIERVQFFDSILSFETFGVAPQAYRLYQAAFDRAPDTGGLGFWVNAMEHGFSLGSVAQMFITSPEFTSRYGVSASPDSIIAGFYQNVLHRPPDAGGFDFWLDVVKNKHAPLADVLVAFSESAENQAQLIGVLQGGFEFSH